MLIKLEQKLFILYSFQHLLLVSIAPLLCVSVFLLFFFVNILYFSYRLHCYKTHTQHNTKHKMHTYTIIRNDSSSKRLNYRNKMVLWFVRREHVFVCKKKTIHNRNGIGVMSVCLSMELEMNAKYIYRVCDGTQNPNRLFDKKKHRIALKNLI